MLRSRFPIKSSYSAVVADTQQPALYEVHLQELFRFDQLDISCGIWVINMKLAAQKFRPCVALHETNGAGFSLSVRTVRSCLQATKIGTWPFRQIVSFCSCTDHFPCPGKIHFETFIFSLFCFWLLLYSMPPHIPSRGRNFQGYTNSIFQGTEPANVGKNGKKKVRRGG